MLSVALNPYPESHEQQRSSFQHYLPFSFHCQLPFWYSLCVFFLHIRLYPILYEYIICHKKCLAKGLLSKCQEEIMWTDPDTHAPFFGPVCTLSVKKLPRMSGCLIDSSLSNCCHSLTDEEVFALIAIGHLRLLSVFFFFLSIFFKLCAETRSVM